MATWIEQQTIPGGGRVFRCSHCGQHVKGHFVGRRGVADVFRFCYGCGAQMVGEQSAVEQNAVSYSRENLDYLAPGMMIWVEVRDDHGSDGFRSVGYMLAHFAAYYGKRWRAWTAQPATGVAWE